MDKGCWAGVQSVYSISDAIVMCLGREPNNLIQSECKSLLLDVWTWVRNTQSLKLKQTSCDHGKSIKITRIPGKINREKGINIKTSVTTLSYCLKTNLKPALPLNFQHFHKIICFLFSCRWYVFSDFETWHKLWNLWMDELF